MSERENVRKLIISSEFVIVEESTGISQLIGERCKVRPIHGVNPLAAPRYGLYPIVGESDKKWRGLFSKIPPIAHNLKDGRLYCSCGIVAEMKMPEAVRATIDESGESDD